MCGIVGIWEFAASEGRVDLSLVERMRDTMVHRGPDDSGVQAFDGERGAFGFRRLSIIDLSAAGHQPMTGCSDQKVLMVFNGEIYNHAALREGLEERGHTYHSRTDSETLIHLYEERGTGFVDEIEGDYGIAIWDEAAGQLSLYRDRMGVKPLYYHIAKGRIIFASEIKAIVEHPQVERDVDETALVDYLTFVTTPAPQTLFKGIHKLPAGHKLVIGRNGDARLEQYWDALPPEAAPERTEAEHTDAVLSLLRDSIRERMMSDVPFGVFLSGGVDSSANVALMSELMTRPVDTFTVGFKDREYLNELDSARRIAAMFGTNHHEVIIGDREFNDFLPDLIYHQDEPIADPVCVPLYYVSKLANDSGTTVIQVGEGADEIFSGYEMYVRTLRTYERVWRHAERFPAALKAVAGRSVQTALTAAGKHRIIAELGRRLAEGQPMFWGGAVIFDDSTKPKLLSPKLRDSIRSSISVVQDYLSRIAGLRPGSDFLTQMIYLELKLRLPELLLMRVDKITMATSVEARVPFLDHHLVEYAMGIPRDQKVSGNIGKHILKRALESILPNDLLYSRKRGFGAPIREWFREGESKEFIDRLLRSRIRERGFFDYGFIERMLSEHRSNKSDWSFQLWALVNLTLWYDHWIENE